MVSSIVLLLTLTFLCDTDFIMIQLQNHFLSYIKFNVLGLLLSISFLTSSTKVPGQGGGGDLKNNISCKNGWYAVAGKVLWQ